MCEVEEESYRCPYEPGHSILKSRIQTHLVRCEANNKHLKMVRCPFNAVHVIRRKELKEHISVCDYRPEMNNDTASASAGSSFQSMRDILLHTDCEISIPAESLEEWDEEPPAPSYLDSLQNQDENRNVVRNLMLASKKQKKKFRQAERKRFGQNSTTETQSNMP